MNILIFVCVGRERKRRFSKAPKTYKKACFEIQFKKEWVMGNLPSNAAKQILVI